MPSIRDREVEILATYSGCLQSDYDKDDPAWRSSPFDWIKKINSSRRKGTIGEKLISGYLACKGFDVNRSPDSEADRIVGGKRVEIKMSTLWEAGHYKFQQFRDQNYDFVVCLGLSKSKPLRCSLLGVAEAGNYSSMAQRGYSITARRAGWQRYCMAKREAG